MKFQLSREMVLINSKEAKNGVSNLVSKFVIKSLSKIFFQVFLMILRKKEAEIWLDYAVNKTDL